MEYRKKIRDKVQNMAYYAVRTTPRNGTLLELVNSPFKENNSSFPTKIKSKNNNNMKRRVVRKRRFRRRKQARRVRAVQPYTIVRKLPTSFYNSVDCGAGTLSVNYLHLNSAYDPCGDISATIQAMGFDQYEALYNKYCVIGYKVVIEAICTDNTNPVTIGFTPMTSSSTLTTQHRYMEMPGTVWRVMTPDIDRVVLTVKGSIKRWMLPRGGKILSDDLLSASYTQSPSKLLYGHIWLQAQDSTADPSAVKYTVNLKQLVVFYDPKTPARSTQ